MTTGCIIRVFPRRTKATPVDGMAFVGEPPLSEFRPPADEVHVSVTFTWDLKRAEELARSWGRFYPKVRVGGPALGDAGGEFVSGMYLREGFTITSRGCPNACPFCLVRPREGTIRELPIADGFDVQDNNLLACSDTHQDAVFAMLARQKTPIQFTGGLEARRVDERVIQRLQRVRVGQLFLAYDSTGAWPMTVDAIQRLRAAGLKLRQVRCYVLSGFGEDTVAAAEARCGEVLAAGALPFMMIYQPPDQFIQYSRQWRNAARKWTRPAAMLAIGRQW